MPVQYENSGVSQGILRAASVVGCRIGYMARHRRRKRLKIGLLNRTLLIATIVGIVAKVLSATALAGGSDPADSQADERLHWLPTASAPTAGSDPIYQSVFVGGDSLTFTAMWDHGPGEGAPADLTWAAWLGWTAADVQPQLDSAVANGRADTVVIALGTNDSSLSDGDGWSATDVKRFQQLIDAAPSTACVVIVLPGYGDGVDPQHAAEMDEARGDLNDLANSGRNAAQGSTVVVDWQAQLDDRPDLLAADGIHLASDPVTGDVSAEAAAARTNLYWQGVRACAGD
jgi:GDSL-like Lipase/Acylhydrolase family